MINSIFSQIFESVSVEELYELLQFFINEDCYIIDFLDNSILEDLLTFMVDCNILWIASDDRVLLTSEGEQVTQILSRHVDFGKKAYKIKKEKYGYNKNK